MSCWCGADTQQQDYPPFGYFCTAVEEHDPFQVPIEEALGDVIPSRTTDPVTSHAAAKEIRVKAGSQRAHLLASFYAGDIYAGLTDEQAMNRAGSARVSPFSEYSKRCSELREGGFIEPTGETRAGSAGPQRIVSKITEFGREWIRNNT